jgi:ADP-ribose pyrophosphatase YjhB (NUDIX family)
LEKIKAYGICLYKYNKNSIKVLLCKSANSKDRWGFLKGVANSQEEPVETALREFEEECSIKIDKENLENLFVQKNDLKNIGIYLVNYNKISNLDKYFNDEILYKKNLSLENTDVEFFSIDKLPLIKKKQKFLTQEIIKYLSQNN